MIECALSPQIYLGCTLGGKVWGEKEGTLSIELNGGIIFRTTYKVKLVVEDLRMGRS